MGALRRPDRPIPVTCVLAVVLLPAAISQRFGPSECAGPRSVPAQTNLVALGERLNANSILSAISHHRLWPRLARRKIGRRLRSTARQHQTTAGDEHSFCNIGA